MRRILGHSVRWGWFVFSGLVIVTAIAVSSARLLAPQVADYRKALEQAASHSLGRPVTIGAVRFQFQGFQTLLELRDIRVYDAEGGEVLQSMRRAFIVPDWLNTVLNGSLKMRELIFSRARVGVLLDRDAQLSLRGIHFGSDSDWLETLGQLVDSQPRIVVVFRDSTLDWVNELDGSAAEFTGVDLSAARNEEIFQLAAVTELPPGFGRSLQLVGRFRGRLSDPAGWHGRVYVKAGGIRLGAARGVGTDWWPETGAVSLESWSEWRAGRPSRAVGRVNVSDLRLSGSGLPGPDTPFVPVIDHLSANFLWQVRDPGWALSLDELRIVVDGKSWPTTQGGVTFVPSGARSWSGRGAIDYVDVDDVWAFRPILARPEIGVDLAALSKVALSGGLTDLRFSASGDGAIVSEFAASADFEGLATSASDSIPGVKGLSGSLRVDQSGGWVELDGRDLFLEVPRLFSTGIWLDRLSGTLSWTRTSEGVEVVSPQFSVRNPDIAVHGNGRVFWGAETRDLDIDLSFHDGVASRVDHYLPDRILDPEVSDWLRKSVRAGDIPWGHLVFKGDPYDYPFAQGEGLFEASMQLENGVLALEPGAPVLYDIAGQLVFRNRSLDLTADRARWLDVSVHPVRVRINDLQRTRLDVSGAARGNLSSMSSIASTLKIPVASELFRDRLKLSGQGDLQIELRIPISDRLGDEKTRVEGALLLEDGALAVRGDGFSLSDLSGSLTFDRAGVEGEGISAVWAGRPVVVDARRSGDAGQQVVLNGHMALDDLFSGGLEPLSGYVSGETQWRVELTVSDLEDTGDAQGTALRITSGLEGLTVALPPPLGKSASEERSFELRATWKSGLEGPVKLRYGPLSAVMEVKERRGATILPRGSVAINRGEPVLPSSHWRFEGDVDTFSVDAWKAVYDAWADSGAGGESSEILFSEIDAAFDRFEVADRTFHDVDVNALRNGAVWVVRVDSPAVRGQGQVPVDWKSGTSLAAQFERMIIPESSASDDASSLDPRLLPALSLRSKLFQYGGYAFHDAKVEASRIPEGMAIHLLELQGEKLTMQATGEWLVDQQEVQRTRVQIKLKSDDLGEDLRAFDLAQGVEGGKADMNIELKWNRGLFGFGYESLAGDAEIDVRDGRLNDIDTGAGRLIGLLNIGALARRVSLDFRDVLESGYAFDRLRGRFVVEGPEIVTRKFLMQGPAADISVTGRTNIATRSYDQVVTVIPEVGGGAAVAGTVLGGPVVGAAVLLLDRVMDSLERGLGRLVAIKYRVTGSWDDPVIAKIKQTRRPRPTELEETD